MESLKFVMMSTFYPPYHIGGDALHVFYLSNELAKLGHEVHIIHSIDSYRLKRNDKHKGGQQSNQDNVFLYPIKSPIGEMTPLISYVSGISFPTYKKIDNIIKDIRPDVLHHHNIAGFGPFIFDLKSPKVLYTVHDHWLICPMNGFIDYNGDLCHNKNCFLCSLMYKRPPQIWRYIIDINKKIRENVDTIIYPSNFMKDKMKDFKIDSVVIPNFVPRPEIEKGKPLFNFSYFLFVGALDRQKGIVNLINTFTDSKDKINAKLIIVGDGPLRNDIKIMINNNRLNEKIIMLGRIDNLEQLANIYTNSLALIVPSIYPENCPLVTLEAMANDTLIIVSNSKGGLSEIAQKADIPIFTDEIELKRLLIKVDKGEIKYKDKDLLNIYNKYYSPQRFMSKYLDVIK